MVNFSFVWRYLPDLIEGTRATFLLSAEVIALGTLVGVALVPLRVARHALLRWLGWLVVNPFRILPALVLLVWGFYALPMVTGRRFEPWTVAVIALGFNMGGYCAEIFRKAVEEVPAEHVEAAQLLGFRRSTVWWQVILPLAWRNAGIPYLNQVLQTVKLTVLAAVISVREIFHVVADVIQMTNRPLEMYTVLAVVLFVPLLLLTLSTEWLEARIARGGTVRTWAWIEGAA